MPESEECRLHEWLRRTAAATPDFPAIIEDEDRITSFTELLCQAEALASTLSQRGVRRGDRVALVLSKTTEAIVSIFASLLAGAVYVPIPPGWPAERIESTLDDCAASAVIAISSGLPTITFRRCGETISWTEALAARPRVDAATVVHADEPALILFTSGSTGQPKGVVLSHRAVSAFVKWTACEFGIGATDRIAVPSPLGFDLSTFDIFNMALCGAACVLVPENIVWMPRFLVEFVREARITCWYSVPSILAGMLEESGFTAPMNPELRLILFAGEVFAGPNVARLQTAMPQAVCVNLYGPTETNVVTWQQIPPGFDPADSLPIGKPCPYAEVTMVTASGELLAGGESTMLGYWNRPEETARAFVFEDSRRYYRTGDRVSRDSAGNYIFLGRLDRQVKRRGFRIELGEIEAAVLRHEAVLEVATVSSDNPEFGTVIAAFVKLRPATGMTPIEAKAHCARLLPPYMLPDRVVFVDEIPRGSRGKIDYTALKRVAEA